MEKVVMKQEVLNEIPVFKWKGVSLIPIGEEMYVTAEPIGKGIRTLEVAKRMARQFEDRYHCPTTVTNEKEWMKVIKFLKNHSVTDNFIELNKLDICEALLLDTTREVKEFVLAGGQEHDIYEIFNGFISDFDADGEKQPMKVIFFTLKLDC